MDVFQSFKDILFDNEDDMDILKIVKNQKRTKHFWGAIETMKSG